MFKAIRDFVNTGMFGKPVYSYDPIEVRHGAIRCTDRFEIRDRKGLVRLLHERAWEDGRNAKQFSSDHEEPDARALRDVFVSSHDRIERGEAHDYGVVITERDGRMRPGSSYAVEGSGDEHVLHERIESSVDDSVIDGFSSSDDLDVTYFSPAEIQAIARVLDDALTRMG